MSDVTKFFALALNTALAVVMIGMVVNYDPMRSAINHAVLLAIMDE
jgi:hypothetical protein